MSNNIDLKAIEAGVKLYRYDGYAHRVVDMCVAHSLNEYGEPGEHDFRRFAHDVAALATTTLLQHVYTNDHEIARLKEERDHWKRLAEEGLNLVPIGQFVIPKGDTSQKRGDRA